jgi:hypothetical protein
LLFNEHNTVTRKKRKSYTKRQKTAEKQPKKLLNNIKYSQKRRFEKKNGFFFAISFADKKIISIFVVIKIILVLKTVKLWKSKKLEKPILKKTSR